MSPTTPSESGLPMKSIDQIRVVVANFASWTGTAISFQMVESTLRILVLLGSFCVSIASVWWIIRQARALERNERKPRD